MASTSKRSAEVTCRGGSLWVSPKQFWLWVREGIVEYMSEPPLTGRFHDDRENFLISVRHTLLNITCPEHMRTVLLSRRQRRK